MSAPPAIAGVLWDTMFASQLQPTRRELLDAALLARGTDLEPLLSAPVVAEVVYGLRLQAARAPEFATLAVWWEGHIAADGEFRVLLPSRHTLIVAARARALQPASPAKPAGRESRAKPERRVSWVRDIELGAIAATHGLPLATLNRSDLEPIARLIARVAPTLPALVLLDDPLG